MSTFNELIDFTRSTTGTYLDSVVYGPELVTNGTFDSDSDWAKGTGWAISGGTASKTAGTGSSIVSTTLNGTIGKSYLLTFDLTLSAGVINSTLGADVTPVYNSSGSYAEILKPTTTGAFQFYGSAAFAGSIDNVSVKEVIGGQVSGTPLLRTAAINEPRLEYDASGNPLGLLIEEARTNVAVQSQSFSGWIHDNIVVSVDSSITSPAGNSAVSKLTLQQGSTQKKLEAPNAIASFGDTACFSVWLKYGTHQYVDIYGAYGHWMSSNSGCKVDMLNGTVTDYTSSTASTIQEYPNGWYYVQVTSGTSMSGASAKPFYLWASDASSGPTSGTTSTGYFYAWGAQTEVGSFPTSYIPTSGSGAARAADFASLPVERFAYNQPQGSIVCHFTYFFEQGASKRAYEFSDGTDNNVIRIIDHTNVNQLQANFKSGGAGVAGILINAPTMLSGVKTFQTYKLNDYSGGADGTLAGTDSNGLLPVGINKLSIGSRRDGAATMNGHITSLQYYPKKLTDAQLELLTQPSASPTMNLTFDGQATSTLVEGLHD